MVQMQFHLYNKSFTGPIKSLLCRVLKFSGKRTFLTFSDKICMLVTSYPECAIVAFKKYLTNTRLP